MTTRQDRPKALRTTIGGNPLSRVFKIQKETHTLGNVLKGILLQHENVNFAAYSVPHPLTEEIEMRVQVNEGEANDAMKDALKQLMNEIEDIDTLFDEAVEDVQMNAMQD
eukprot:CAMPEP_0117437826 /NCGR_PEP_ID=MMETSP0759-20121206/1731_1 /TAXON_ID=63605 /ORGANISM="Percolomonas cosmopolitus, Strain WS" /LENGTH=109 /DNA_ID=CAMNT_0005229485 /DNA_START=35 /DNA_END=364 /DNA_ORIENTATION=-